ncbi:DNA translocase FtsK [Bacillus pumilus]|uniref:DNA translocase FtsK n=1 Tax=Bacillus pumilus TaxID=1408 RepID=UPI00017A64DE|nr:DNA translocase FtsK [Bacillus pumilus]EDW20058.1 dna translocase ftsk (dna translocase spoiiie) [Bacillus pumilus ATCC 7061]MDR4271686.1 DNA translocase FtsK [Bacillus pumilus]MED4630813.1 DNA translocase FtsK [Bacillus pumilus]MED4676093.1 DNA translocase FtsK [Bacillus pumilus]MED4726334.1 DNA translocase FtsK [Bacillus pumilus]
MMSWLDKFFSVFLGEEKKEEKAVRPEEGPVAPKQPVFEQHKEYKKIEDTKVYYEYPTGNFRFPLVPDEPQRDGVKQERRRPKQGQPKAKQKTYESKQTVQPDIHKKPFKPEQIPSPIYGYHQDMRPKRTESKEESSSVQMKAAETAQRVTLLSEEAERERNVRQQMNIPSIRKENRMEETVSAPAEERVDMQTDVTPLTLQEELAYHDHVQSTMERLNDEPFIQTEEKEPAFSEPQDHIEADLHHQQAEVYHKPPVESEPVPVQDVSSGNEEIQDEPVEQFVDHTKEIEPLTFETAEDTHSAIEMEVDMPAEEVEVLDVISAEPVEEIAADSLEDHQEEVPAAALEETEPVAEHDLQEEQLIEEAEIVEDQVMPIEQVADEQTATERVESVIEQQEKQEQVHEVMEEKPKQASPQPQRASGQTSTVPFNVMMLKSDQRVQGQKKAADAQGYVFPSLALLDVPPAQKEEDGTWVKERAELLNATLKNFNVRASVVHVTQGPSVTRFEVHPEPGVKVNKITNLSDDIKLSLSAKDIRIEAPIPGKNTIGIEVPNLHSKMVFLREMIRSSAFRDNPSPLTAALGLDISGQPVVVDLQKMPHGLIAGATGSGKSVCINTILVSLMFKASPDEVKMLLIDPKMVELAPYNHIPHLVSPVITDAKTATAALKWVVDEMERRYELFAHSGVREIKRFNELVKEKQMGEKLPYLVVVIDELADLMMVAPNEVEESICRIAQKARACGIHLLIATQRPSVDVITGLIKANIPTRIAFSVSSQVDSRTIIDMAGAEKLLGKGDMLFLENGSGKPTRLQGNFVSDREIDQVVAHVRKQRKPVFLFEQEELMLQGSAITDEDELFMDACRFAIEQNSASTSSLQRRFRIGYNRAARLIDMMEREGMISGAKGSKPREVLMTLSDLEQLI